MRRAAVYLIRAYRFCISPFLGGNCRFYPTCSSYAETAIDRFGVAKGSWLFAKRICRCHPWHCGGIDHVPEKNDVPTYG